jgi:hypothetical protein
VVVVVVVVAVVVVVVVVGVTVDGAEPETEAVSNLLSSTNVSP